MRCEVVVIPSNARKCANTNLKHARGGTRQKYAPLSSLFRRVGHARVAGDRRRVEGGDATGVDGSERSVDT